ncbi:pyridoxal phosphate-dependent aminotransferase [Limibacillus halophilus]|uniref:Histidinol-phosphate aminotransferase n=1 Tax=Limibacillus halophilus TaxID=1579333 RepID=A0A839SS89_9PROT|nr:histidinol-phosphate transaminase [Limibacillus halophilus]MBB3063763.1 histidinol-phosphate aminotransferase [Limibacillus halophilus]
MTLNSQSRELASLRLYEAETSVETIALRYGLEASAVIDFSLNVNPLGSPPSAIAAASAALERSNLYPDINFQRLRSALAARHELSEECLFFGAGLDDVIKLLLQAWTSEGDKVLIHIPTFPRYELEARLRGCTLVVVENDPPEEISTAAIARELTASDIALAFICTPNNPTGATVSNDDIERMARRHPDTIFIIDEALIYPSEDGAMPLARKHDNIVVLRTFSKYFGLAGLRIGYAVAPSSLVRVAEVGRPPFNMAASAVCAAAAALADTTFLPACKAQFRNEVAWFLERVASIPRLSIRGGNANMLLLDIGDRDPGVAAAELAANGIVVADATSFRGLEKHNVLRVSLRGHAENLKLISALEALQ